MPEHVDRPSFTHQARTALRDPSASSVADLGASALSTTFEALSGLRRARFFHPHGVVVRGRANIPAETAPTGFPHGEHEALVRLSRGIGTPDHLPDIMGIAVRFIDVGGPGKHQDLLFATTGASPLTRKLLRPTRTFTSGTFSTLLPYDSGGRRVVFGATLDGARGTVLDGTDALTAALERGALTVNLRWAASSGDWRPLGTVALGPSSDVDDVAGLGFDPFNTVDELPPAGWLNRLRPPAYFGSRRGRALADRADREAPDTVDLTRGPAADDAPEPMPAPTDAGPR